MGNDQIYIFQYLSYNKPPYGFISSGNGRCTNDLPFLSDFSTEAVISIICPDGFVWIGHRYSVERYECADTGQLAGLPSCCINTIRYWSKLPSADGTEMIVVLWRSYLRFVGADQSRSFITGIIQGIGFIKVGWMSRIPVGLMVDGFWDVNSELQ